MENNGGKPIDITLKSASIQISGAEKSAFSIKRGAVNLTLEGTNTMQSSNNRTGISVSASASLTITAASTGSLRATSGGSGGAGIGASSGYALGSITINGGIIDATGGQSASGIGGDERVPGGSVTINGGTVTGNGGKYGAGIGEGTKVVITGGVVIAKGGDAGDGIAGSFSTGTDGKAAITANSISDQSNSAKWSGLILTAGSGGIYGNSFTLPGDVTIPNGTRITMNSSQTLTVPAGTTLIVLGIIYKNGATIGGDGRIVYPQNILPATPIDIDDGDDVKLVSVPGFSCSPCTGHTITGTTTSNSITVVSGHHYVTLMDLDISDLGIGHAFSSVPFTVKGGATVDVTLLKTNPLIGRVEFTALRVEWGVP